MAIRFFDMFAGIGGFRSGLESVGGFSCVGYCEIDKYVRKDYEAMYDTEELIRILYIEPHKEPCVKEIPNTLEAQQQAVKGRIEYIINDDRTIFVVNEEHKINGMEGNRRIEGDVIAGPFFIVGDVGEDVCSLTDEQIEKYAKRFEAPEDISPEEIFEHLIRPAIFVQSM